MPLLFLPFLREAYLLRPLPYNPLIPLIQGLYPSTAVAFLDRKRSLGTLSNKTDALTDTGKFSESLLKQGSYKEELSASLKDVASSSEKLQEEANQCLAWRLYRQDRMLQQTDQKADQGLNILQSIYTLLRANPILSVNPEGKFQASP